MPIWNSASPLAATLRTALLALPKCKGLGSYNPAMTYKRTIEVSCSKNNYAQTGKPTARELGARQALA